MRRRWAALALVAALAVSWTEAAVATDWNPNDTTTVGLETFFTAQGEQLIAGGAAVAALVPSTASETIDSVGAYLAGATDEDTRLLLEVFASGDEVPSGDVTTTTFMPSDDLQIGGADSESSAWIEGTTSGGLGSIGTTNLYAAIDETSLDVDDWIAYNGSRAARKRYRFNIPTSGGSWPANRRIVGGRLRITLNRESTSGRLEVGYHNGTSTYRLGSVTATPQRRTVTVPFPEYNPATGLPWTRGQIQDLASTAGFQLRPAGVGKQKRLRVYRVAVELDWVTESRVAVGVATVDDSTVGDGGWTTFSLSVPNSGADNWSKSNGTDYVFVLRRISGLGSVGWRWLAEGADVAAALGRSAPGEMLPVSAYVPTMGSRGMVSSLGDAVPGRAMTLKMTTTAPATSGDGLTAVGLDFDYAYSGNNASIDFTVGANGSYGLARFLWVDTGSDEATPDGLEFYIDTTGGTAPRLSSIETMTVAELRASPLVGYARRYDHPTETPLPVHYVEVAFDTPAPLVTATSYTLTITTTEASATSPHAILALDADDPVSGWASGDTGEPVATLSITPAAPASFAATTNPRDSGNEGDCGPASIDRIDLTHNATGLGGSFARYEYQRQDPDGTWRTIHTDADSAATTHHDWEARLDQVETYRMRQVRAGDLVPSAWTATDTATAAAYGHETKIASNHADTAVAYERGPDYEWTNPAERRVAGRQGADGRWVFRPSEDPGIDTTADLLVYGGPGPTSPGLAVFDDLRDLLAADVPHLTVCDADGGRLYGDVAWTRHSRTETGGDSVYEASVAITETQFAPTPVTA